MEIKIIAFCIAFLFRKSIATAKSSFVSDSSCESPLCQQQTVSDMNLVRLDGGNTILTSWFHCSPHIFLWLCLALALIAALCILADAVLSRAQVKDGACLSAADSGARWWGLSLGVLSLDKVGQFVTLPFYWMYECIAMITLWPPSCWKIIRMLCVSKHNERLAWSLSLQEFIRRLCLLGQTFVPTALTLVNQINQKDCGGLTHIFGNGPPAGPA